VRVAEAGAGSVEARPEIFADLDGKDNEFLMARSGEVLKALEHIAFRALGLEPVFHERFTLIAAASALCVSRNCA